MRAVFNFFSIHIVFLLASTASGETVTYLMQSFFEPGDQFVTNATVTNFEFPGLGGNGLFRFPALDGDLFRIESATARLNGVLFAGAVTSNPRALNFGRATVTELQMEGFSQGRQDMNFGGTSFGSRIDFNDFTFDISERNDFLSETARNEFSILVNRVFAASYGTYKLPSDPEVYRMSTFSGLDLELEIDFTLEFLGEPGTANDFLPTDVDTGLGVFRSLADLSPSDRSAIDSEFQPLVSAVPEPAASTFLALIGTGAFMWRRRASLSVSKESRSA